MHRAVAAIIVLLTTVLVSQAQTTTNNLDSTFGTAGVVRTDFAGNIDLVGRTFELALDVSPRW